MGLPHPEALGDDIVLPQGWTSRLIVVPEKECKKTGNRPKSPDYRCFHNTERTNAIPKRERVDDYPISSINIAKKAFTHVGIIMFQR